MHKKSIASQPIVLVGMMGTGKSHVGARLADALGCSFFDSDSLIEQETSHTIPEIFEKWGEAEFRRLEKAKIKELVERETGVISTGGGSIADDDTRAFLKESACVVWLSATPNTIYERVKGNDNRPLLACENPRKEIENLLDARKSYYAEAHIHVKTDNRDANGIVKEILDQIDTL